MRVLGAESSRKTARIGRLSARVRQLRHDPVNVSRRGVPPRRHGGVPLSLPLLALASVGLLLLSRIDHSATRALRVAIADTLSPVLALASHARGSAADFQARVAGLIDADNELQRLRRENAALKVWRTRAADLASRVAELAAMSHAPQDSDWNYVSARVVADGTGGFARALLVNAGRDESLRVGYPAVTRDGLVGRLVGVGQRSANVLLLTDVASHVPVLVGPGKVRAVLAGEDEDQPRLTFIAGGEPTVGEEVVTSGTGGVFPRGLKVGHVVAGEGGPRVRLNVRPDEIEELSVLLYDTAAAELVDDPGRTRLRQASGRSAASAAGEVPR